MSLTKPDDRRVTARISEVEISPKARFTEACNYPGLLDEARVEQELERYLRALGVKRKIVRLCAGWTLPENPPLMKYVGDVLADFAKRSPQNWLAALAALDALDALAARDARDARDALDARAARAALAARDALDALDARALHRFAALCVQAGGWWWGSWELSWIVTTYLGALQNQKPEVATWSEPLFEAFVAGAWILRWTEDTLYWVAKPRVHVEKITGGRRLSCETGPAVESDVEPLYFWHGVMVPEHVVMCPEAITINEIRAEENAEVRRVMMERYGLSRYLEDSGAQLVHEDELGKLYRTEIADDEPLVMVKVMNSTAEPDGTRKAYFLRVPPDMTVARDAVAWTFGYPSGEQYAKALLQQT